MKSAKLGAQKSSESIGDKWSWLSKLERSINQSKGTFEVTAKIVLDLLFYELNCCFSTVDTPNKERQQ